MQEIAKSSGISRATLHRHFGTREELLRELALESIREIDEVSHEAIRGAPDTTTAFRKMVEAIVPLGDRYHFLAWEGMTARDPEVAKALDRQLAELRMMIDAVKQEGGFARDVPTAWIVAATDALIYSAWSSVRDGYVARRDVPDLLLRTLFAGLRPDTKSGETS